MFLNESDVIFLYECGFSEGDINVLKKELRKKLHELNEEYLDHYKNQKESILEKFLKK